ncbi:hypothetical protein NYE54_08035 [Paenibacillus sp. FSL K6-1330]|uniref:hypothetical protein n=1 Tax=Paenibacillus sp. FSL K6-1330 TaxID=2975292 RepID=UPI0030D7A0F7
MAFEGFRGDRRGNWFGGGVQTNILYVHNNEAYDFFLINEQEEHVIRIRDEQQIELMYCMHGTELDREQIDWMINKSGFRYYDSVDDYRAYYKAMLEDLKK